MAFEMAAEKQAVVVGIDGSEQSQYALKWALDHFFPSPFFKLILIHARPFPTSVMGLGVWAMGSADMVHIVDSNSMKHAVRVMETAQQICINHPVNDLTTEIVEGKPGNALVEAVDKYNATTLIVGCRGHGAIKRAIFGSVSDHCAHSANCTVIIVKKPKI